MSKLIGRKPVEVKLSDQQGGGVPVYDSSTRSWTTVSRYLLASGSAVISGSQTFIGDQTISGSLTVSGGVTGSLLGTASYADNAWALGGNTFTDGAADRALGTLSNHHLSIYTSGSRVATFTNSGSLFIAPYLPGILNNEIFLIDAGVTTSHNLIRALSDIDDYSQFNIQNFSTGSNASSDIVATANNGSEIGQYINMGINSNTFTGSIGDANDAYLYSTGNHLHIGNASNSYVGFFAGSDDVDVSMKLLLDPSNLHQMTGSLDVSGSIVAQSFTGSLEGTSSVAVSASYASVATSASYALTSSYVENAQTASYVLNAQSASYWSGSIINAATASYIETAQTASYILNAISSSYSSNADLLDGKDSSIFATTSSNIFSGSQTVSGSINVSGSVNVNGVAPWDLSIMNVIQLGRASVNGDFNEAAIGANAYYNGSWKYTTNNTATQFQLGDKTFIFRTGDGGSVGSDITWSEKLRLADNGNLLINNPTNNIYRLNVEGTGRFGGNVDITGSLNITQGITGSLLGTASYAAQALSSSFATTASSADDFLVRGTLTAQTIVAQTITSSIEFITGSTKNGSLLTNTHEFTGSVGITGSLEINGSDYITTSGSVSTRLTDLETFSGSYSTGSFTGSFIGRVTGSFSGSLYNLQNSVLGHIPFFSASQVLSDSIVRQLDNGSSSFSIVINQDNITAAAPEALYVWQPSDTSYNVVAGKGNLDNYLQLNIQNLNTGENASSDVVATANNGNESVNYINMGINSDGFTGSIGNENDAYLYSTGNHLHIGNTSPNQPLGLFVGGDEVEVNRKLVLRPNNQHEVTGSLDVSGSIVAHSFTGSLQGTASWANNAINATSASYAVTASSAINADNAQTASYVLNAVSASFATSALTASNANTASYVQLAQTASHALNAISSSYSSNADLLDGKDSTTFATTGSNIFVGNQTITGSFAVSGSTTQIGNNTLLGNTTLSGSIIISGSVNALANINLGGTLRLDPTEDPGSQNITASFLFTSASNTATGFDLYYRQNNNLTKFKWLEGMLNTGILYGGILTYSSSYFYLSSGSGIIVNHNATTGSEINPIVTYVNWNASTHSIANPGAQNTYVFIDANGDLQQQTSFFTAEQYHDILPIGRVSHYGDVGSIVTGVGNNILTAYDVTQQLGQFTRAFGPLKISGFTITPQVGNLSLNIGSGTAFNLGGYYQNTPDLPSTYNSNTYLTSSIIRIHRSGSGFKFDNNGGSYYTSVNPLLYDDGDGTLASVGNGNWSIQRVFVNPLTGRSHVYYGQSIYTTYLNAVQSVSTDDFVESEVTKNAYVFAGYLVMEGGAGNTDLSVGGTTNAIIQAGLFRNSVGGSGGATTAVSELNDISDVTITTPSNGQALIYNSGNWINGTPISASHATTASFALTASYISGSGGGVGFPFSGSAVITGSLLISSSFVDFTQATYVTGSFTGSFSGTVATASYALFAANAPGTTTTMTQSVAATTWSFTHNLNTKTPLLQVYDSTNHQIVPLEIIGSDPNQATIYFDVAESGYAVASNGGSLTVSGSTARLDQTSAAVTWSFNHNLATKYPNFEIWDSSDNIVIPGGIHAVNDMTAEIYFAFPTTGVAIASFSGIAGSPNATTASYAVSASNATTASYAAFSANTTTASFAVTASHVLGQSPTSSYALTASYVETAQTASYVLNAVSSSYAATSSYSNNFTVGSTLTIDQSLTDYHTVASSAAGENNMFNVVTGSYSAAFFKYTVANGSNARSGEVMAVWNGGAIQYTDNSTVDIGDTSEVTAAAVIVSNVVQFNLTTATSGWKLKSLGTFM